MATGAHASGASRSACSRRSRVPRESLSAGEVGFIIAGIKELQGARKVGDTVTLVEPARPPTPLPGFKEMQAAGVRRPLSRSRRTSTTRCATRWRSCKLNDAVAALRAGSLAGAGLRLPLRLPRPAAHGDRAGAPGARVRHGPDHHRADRGLPGAAARRHACIEIENPSKLPDPSQDRGDPRADHHRDDPDAAGLRRPGDHAVHREARRAEEHAVPRPPGAC